jgi:hypothetical protein
MTSVKQHTKNVLEWHKKEAAEQAARLWIRITLIQHSSHNKAMQPMVIHTANTYNTNY